MPLAKCSFGIRGTFNFHVCWTGWSDGDTRKRHKIYSLKRKHKAKTEKERESQREREREMRVEKKNYELFECEVDEWRKEIKNISVRLLFNSNCNNFIRHYHSLALSSLSWIAFVLHHVSSHIHAQVSVGRAVVFSPLCAGSCCAAVINSLYTPERKEPGDSHSHRWSVGLGREKCCLASASSSHGISQRVADTSHTTSWRNRRANAKHSQSDWPCRALARSRDALNFRSCETQ